MLGERGLVVGDDLLLGLGPASLERSEVTLSLESLGGDESLDLGRLGGGLAVLLGDLSGDDVLADVVLLGQAKESADAGRSLGAETCLSTHQHRRTAPCAS